MTLCRPSDHSVKEYSPINAALLDSLTNREPGIACALRYREIWGEQKLCKCPIAGRTWTVAVEGMMPRNETKTDQWRIPDSRGIDPKDQGTRPQAAPSPEMWERGWFWARASSSRQIPIRLDSRGVHGLHRDEEITRPMLEQHMKMASAASGRCENADFDAAVDSWAEPHGARLEEQASSQRRHPTIEEHIDAGGVGLFQARLFLLTGLVSISDGCEMVVVTILREPMMKEFGVSDMGFATLGSVIFAGLIVGNLAGGFLADAFGRRGTLLGTGALVCLAGAASAAAIDIYTFAVLRFLTGIGIGSLIPVTDALMLEWSPACARSKFVIALVGGAIAAGTVLASLLAIAIHRACGDGTLWWRLVLLACVVPGLIALPLQAQPPLSSSPPVPGLISTPRVSAHPRRPTNGHRPAHFLCEQAAYLPESLHFLVTHGRSDDARHLLERLAAANKTPLLAGGAVLGEGESIPAGAGGARAREMCSPPTHVAGEALKRLLER
jgi:MFS family permease